MAIAAAVGHPDVIRIMVVDDSIVARNLTARWLGEQPGFEVVAACRSGREALSVVAASRPDVAVLDIEMPDMDGVEALPLLLRARPGLGVLMASSLTTKGAEMSLRCLALGATDILAKPSGSPAASDDYRRDLVAKVNALGSHARRRSAAAGRAAIGAVALAQAVHASPASRLAAIRRAPLGVAAPVRALAIGSSTGGPQALSEVLRAIAPKAKHVPIVIAQHMPAGFTAALAGHLEAACRLPAREAADGEPILPGRIYVAPGGRHFSIARVDSQPVARLEDGPPVNFCKPSLEPLFRSASQTYGAGLLAVILTGMGNDGASTVPVIAEAGGRVIAQDEATSVVWGMPGAAAATGAGSAILPLQDIGPRIVSMLSGERQ